MTGLKDALQGRRVIVEIPPGLDGWMAALEVLLQEQLKAWTFAPGDAHLADALATFGRRARIGVHGVRTPAEVADAFAGGAQFVTSPFAKAALLKGAAGPVVLGGLTPTEVQAALSLRPAGVQIVPADALSAAYSTVAGRFFPGETVLANGYLERFHCDHWLDAGASGVCLTSAVFFPRPDAEGLVRPDLAELRRRAQQYGGLEPRRP